MIIEVTDAYFQSVDSDCLFVCVCVCVCDCEFLHVKMVLSIFCGLSQKGHPWAKVISGKVSSAGVTSELHPG